MPSSVLPDCAHINLPFHTTHAHRVHTHIPARVHFVPHILRGQLCERSSELSSARVSNQSRSHSHVYYGPPHATIHPSIQPYLRAARSSEQQGTIEPHLLHNRGAHDVAATLQHTTRGTAYLLSSRPLLYMLFAINPPARLHAIHRPWQFKRRNCTEMQYVRTL